MADALTPTFTPCCFDEVGATWTETKPVLKSSRKEEKRKSPHLFMNLFISFLQRKENVNQRKNTKISSCILMEQ